MIRTITSLKLKIALGIIGGIFLLIAFVLALLLGFGIASTQNLSDLDNFNRLEAALPTQIFDREGRLITEFFSDEKRELISIEEIPQHLIYAVITREDQKFFKHKGISILGTVRAALGYITNNFAGGGSTITQQLATMLYFDKSDISISRKLREMWVAIQLERNWSKTEILEEYLNKSWFGHNTYGVEAASVFFFDHSARELTIAESMMLALQLSSTTKYSPLKNPNQARSRQREMLDEMVVLGYATQSEVDASFDEFWQNYDYTRSGYTTAFFEREDLAPYFSETIRYQLENEILLGNANIYRDGYRVYTTLDLDLQDYAREFLQEGLTSANAVYEYNSSTRVGVATDVFLPIVNLLAYGFDINQLRLTKNTSFNEAKSYFSENIVPFLDLLTLMSENENEEGIREVIASSYDTQFEADKRTKVEGALISIDNETGHVLAMIGGNRFEQHNQFNRALSAQVQPGSSFKPLYYAAAIEKKVITPATMIYDSPVVFWNDDGTPYTPTNYLGEWKGPVLARDALANSMNVPSLRILNRVGFTDAIEITSDLLGVPERERIGRGLVAKYPIGLGVISVSPIMMAKAFAVFPNQGKRVEPVFIRYIEDRTGRIIAEPERDIREELAGNNSQIISPQTAYIMTDMLQSTVSSGTLRYPTNLVNGFDGMPIAGKTGTTQNWSALWTVGFSPYLTTAVWIGFDEGSNSLGVNQTGAVTAGPIWARYMKAAHADLEPKSFQRPSSGITQREVTRNFGLLPPIGFSGETYYEWFISGTEPNTFDESESFENEVAQLGLSRLENNLVSGRFSRNNATDTGINNQFETDINTELNISLSLSPDIANFVLSPKTERIGESNADNTANRENEGENPIEEGLFPLGNPLLENPSLIPPEGISEEGGNPYLD